MTAPPAREEWLIVVPRLPSDPSRYRVAVWRELRRVGAVQLGQGIWALPVDERSERIIDSVAALVPDDVGTILWLDASPRNGATGEQVRAAFDQARCAEWAEFISECAKCNAELQREIDQSKFTLAELDEEEQNVERLRRWHRELRVRDRFSSIDPTEPAGHLAECEALLERFTALVYQTVGIT